VLFDEVTRGRDARVVADKDAGREVVAGREGVGDEGSGGGRERRVVVPTSVNKSTGWTAATLLSSLGDDCLGELLQFTTDSRRFAENFTRDTLRIIRGAHLRQNSAMRVRNRRVVVVTEAQPLKETHQRVKSRVALDEGIAYCLNLLLLRLSPLNGSRPMRCRSEILE